MLRNLEKAFVKSSHFFIQKKCKRFLKMNLTEDKSGRKKSFKVALRNKIVASRNWALAVADCFCSLGEFDETVFF